MSVSIKSSAVLQVLAEANELALKSDWSLTVEENDSWLKRLEHLEQESTPKTYLAILCVTLAARAIFEQHELDVLAIKGGSDPKGYAAPTIGSHLAAFCKEQGIDLRARSSQPLNNQPFTYKTHITRAMSVKRGLQPIWEEFFSALEVVNGLDSDTALSVLALIFDRRRVHEKPKSTVSSESLTLNEVDEFKVRVSEYVSAYSENGRVGQAFAAALYSTIYGSGEVEQGQAQDPDAGKKGDVHVAKDGTNWLWVEVKQKIVSTGDVQGFMDEVRAEGGQRLAYFALANSKYSSNIQEQSLLKSALKNQQAFELYKSPQEALDRLLFLSPGSFSDMVSRFSLEFKERLEEAGVGETLLTLFKESVKTFVIFH